MKKLFGGSFIWSFLLVVNVNLNLCKLFTRIKSIRFDSNRLFNTCVAKKIFFKNF
jgi:hypothetical protein